MRKLQVLVVPFVVRKGELAPDQTLVAKSPEVGIATATKIGPLFAGVGVFGVYVDNTTGDASDPRELFRVGQVPAVDDLFEAA